MSNTWVAFSFEEQVTRVAPGGIIGRLATAALRIDDSRVSEAHALVSRRGRDLKLLALRRWFEVDGERASEVALSTGQHIRLAPGVTLVVEDVMLATTGLVVLGCAQGPVELERGVYSIVRQGDGIQMEPGYVSEALGRVWSTGVGWAGRLEGAPAAELVEGTRLCTPCGDLTVAAVELPQRYTTAGDSSLDPPIRIVVRHDTVHLFRPSRPPVVLEGMSARLVTEVALLGAPAPWDVPAAEIWRDNPPRHILRQNWDRNQRTLRAKLAGARVRTDLLRADGRGNVELFLLPGDVLVDES